MTLFVGKKKKMKATVSGDMQKMKDKQSKAILSKGSSDDYEKFEIPHTVSGIDEKKAVDDLYLAWETVNPTSVPSSLQVAMTKLKIANLKQQLQTLKVPPPENDEETASESSASAGVDEISEKRAEIVPYADCVEASYKHKILEKEETGLPTSPSVVVDDDLSYKCHSEIVARRVDDVSRKCHSEILRYHTDSPNSLIEDDQFNYLKEARSFDTGAGNSSIATDGDSIDTAKGSWGMWKRRNIGSGDGGGSASSFSKKPKNSNSTKKSKNSKGSHLVVTVDSDDNASESSSKKSKNSKNSKKSKGSLVGKVGSFFKKRPSKKTTTSATAKKTQKKQEDVVAAPAPSKCVEEKQKKVPEPTTENKIAVSTQDASSGKIEKTMDYEAIQSLLAESKSFDTADRSCNTLDTAEGSWGLWKDERFFAPDEHASSADKKASSENVNVLLEAGIMLKKWSENVATDLRASSEKVLTKTKDARDDIERRCITAMESTSARRNIGAFQQRELLGSSSSLFGGEGNPPGQSYLDSVVDHFSQKLNMTCNEALDNASSNLHLAVSESDPRKYLCFAKQDEEYYPDEYYPAAQRSQVGSKDNAPGITRTPSILKSPDQMKYTRSGSDLAGDSLPTYSNKKELNILSFVLPGDL